MFLPSLGGGGGILLTNLRLSCARPFLLIALEYLGYKNIFYIFVILMKYFVYIQEPG
jgi:hypothetical protein